MKDYFIKSRAYAHKTVSIWFTLAKIGAVRLVIKACGRLETTIKKVRVKSSSILTNLIDSKLGKIQERGLIFRRDSEEVRQSEVVELPKKKAS